MNWKNIVLIGTLLVAIIGVGLQMRAVKETDCGCNEKEEKDTDVSKKNTLMPIV